jgi:hypothetical protein
MPRAWGCLCALLFAIGGCSSPDAPPPDDASSIPPGRDVGSAVLAPADDPSGAKP